jgi:hypothetical protein
MCNFGLHLCKFSSEIDTSGRPAQNERFFAPQVDRAFRRSIFDAPCRRGRVARTIDDLRSAAAGPPLQLLRSLRLFCFDRLHHRLKNFQTIRAPQP